jgi:hypothetical protein
MNVSSSHLVLLIGDEGVLCAPFNFPDEVAPLFVSKTDKPGAAAILALAAKYAHVPVTLLADTLAQDLRRDVLPLRLNPFDRSKLIRRRLQQAFPQARLCASLTVKGMRGQVLLAGMQSDGPAQLWLDRLAVARPANPPRLCLLPLECAPIVVQLLPQAASGWGLLLSHQRTGGFRQIVVHKGEIVFTRLTPPPGAEAQAADIVAAVSRDLEASRSYLGRLGLDDHAPLNAVLLMPDSLHEELRKADLPVQTPLLISPHEAAWRLGLSTAPPPDDPFGDWVFASWFAHRKRARLALMPPELRRARNSARMARWGLRAAAALLLLACGVAALDASDLVNVLVSHQEQSAQLADLEKKLARERAAAEPVTAPLGRLRQALERQRFYAMPQPSPRAALVALDEGLGTGARLVKFDWQDDDGKAEAENVLVSVRLIEAPNAADRETTVARFKQVAQNLARAMPQYAVDVARYPFPALPQETLSNVAPNEKSDSAEPTADFSLHRVLP